MTCEKADTLLCTATDRLYHIDVVQEFVGVTSFLLVNQGLKRPALMFDRIAIPNLNTIVEYFARHERSRALSADLEWLQKEGVVFQPPSNTPWLDVPQMRPLKEVFLQCAELVEGHRKQEVKTFEEALPSILGVDMLSRIYSVELSMSGRTDAIPLCLYPDVTHLGLECMGISVRPQQVMEVVLQALPVPDEMTSWEAVVDFRSDPESRDKFQRIRKWMSDLVRTDITPAELRGELEWSLDEYGNHLKLHKMKTNAGFLETVVTIGAELIEDVAKFRIAKLAKLPFSARLRTISVLEAEATAPGRELAYIHWARERFGQNQ